MNQTNLQTNQQKEFIYFDDRQILEFIESSEGKNSSLPAVSIACSPACNMRCPHCIYDSGKPHKNPLTPKEKLEILKEAHKLGARYLQICHEGEPFMDSAVIPLVKKAKELGMKTFMYSNGSLITPEIAKILYDCGVCLGVKCDSLNPEVFNKMLGAPKAESVYQGIKNLIEAGYNNPFCYKDKLYTKLCLICTLTTINTESINDIKDVAKFAWDNNLFFGIARLEKGGRAIGVIWKKFKIPDRQKVEGFVNWCSEQTGINYWNAQPTPYCIGVCGAQIADNGDVWITRYGGSCDFTEPDGESYPQNLITIGNLKKEKLAEVVKKIWEFRKRVFEDGILSKKLEDYERTKDVYPNGLQDCGSARTYTLFVPFYEFIKERVQKLK